jgi:hypothetical protein
VFGLFNTTYKHLKLHLRSVYLYLLYENEEKDDIHSEFKIIVWSSIFDLNKYVGVGVIGNYIVSSSIDPHT